MRELGGYHARSVNTHGGPKKVFNITKIGNAGLVE